ncbi:MAG TPA: hypothetical protein VMR37_03435, partial [Rhabdochlamydiaceae bacterium]|nr:hypothetical protein [Rhabdochlamydiaceae bacterium]
MNIREVCEKLKMLHGPSADAPYAEDDDALRFSSFCHDHVLELIEAYEQLQISSHKTWNEANELHHKLEKKEKALNLFFGRLEG